MNEKSIVIARLNDRLRTTLQGGQVVVTAGVDTRGGEFGGKALEAIRAFDNFNPDNDPHGEHDFGVVEVEGQELFWKIDYYDQSLTWHAQDAADCASTVRVMTIMLAEEW